MGANDSKIQGRQIRMVGMQELPYLGKCKIYEALGHNRQIVSVLSQTNNSFDVFEHTSHKHMNLISSIAYDSDYNELLGIKSEKVPFYFDLYRTTLTDIIESRRLSNTMFELRELQRIIRDMLSVLMYYETRYPDQSHWNLNCSNIFYDRNNRQMKIYDNELIQGKMACFYQHFYLQQQYGQDYNCDSYCAPEIAECLKNSYNMRNVIDIDINSSEKDYLYFNKHKTDLYLLGLVILECATYMPSEDLYDKYNFCMRRDEIDARITQVGEIYGDDMENFLRFCLQEDVTLRPTPSQIQEHLGMSNSFRNEIFWTPAQYQSYQPSQHAVFFQDNMIRRSVSPNYHRGNPNSYQNCYQSNDQMSFVNRVYGQQKRPIIRERAHSFINKTPCAMGMQKAFYNNVMNSGKESRCYDDSFLNSQKYNSRANFSPMRPQTSRMYTQGSYNQLPDTPQYNWKNLNNQYMYGTKANYNFQNSNQMMQQMQQQNQYNQQMMFQQSQPNQLLGSSPQMNQVQMQQSRSRNNHFMDQNNNTLF